MKALIIGGGGFLGRELSKKIVSFGGKVDIIDVKAFDSADRYFEELVKKDSICYSNIDISSAFNDHVKQDYTHIFHFAAMLGVQNVIDNPGEVLRKNIDLLQGALALARRQTSLVLFTFASSSEVYAGGVHTGEIDIPTPENVKLILPDLGSPRSTYLLSKIYGEAICHHSGLPFQVIRPHNIYGPLMGFRHVVPELFQKVTQSKDGLLRVNSPNHTRSLCFIADAVEMIFRLASNPNAKGQVFNIGNQNEEVTMLKLAQIIKNQLNVDLSILEMPPTDGSPLRRCPDMTKTIQFSSYECKTPLSTGIELYHEWYRKEKFSV